MTADKDIAVQAITDARALLDTLLGSGWHELHVQSEDMEIFLARPGGGANPMRFVPAVVVEAPAAITAAGAETVVKAPHVATLVDALPIGTTVTAGQKVATLRVLDEEEGLEAPCAGTVVRIGAEVGALLDFGAAVLTIAEAS
jgi:biotin carboxyl carrier protein